MALGRQEAAREAAGEAITALCSFHQDGKLAYLEALVQALSQRKVPQVREGSENCSQATIAAGAAPSC